MTGSPTLRTARPEELVDLIGHVFHAFGDSPSPTETFAAYLPCLDADRTLVAEADGRFAGTATSFDRLIAVPGGGLVRTAAVADVGVARDQRRRGVASALMRAQLHDLADDGTTLSILWASEATIYGRYGYGPAVPRVLGEVDLTHTPFGARGRALLEAFDGELTEHPATEVVDEVAALVTALAPQRPGTMTRPLEHQVRLVDSPAGSPVQRMVLARNASGVTGFANFTISLKWSGHRSAGTVAVLEVAATDPATEAALWRYLLDIDLATTLQARRLPQPALLSALLADTRQLSLSGAEGMWVRLVDVTGALRARALSAALDVVVEVTDDFLGGTPARLALSCPGPGSRADVTVSSAAPDVSIPLQLLGSAYFGVHALTDLAVGAPVVEHTPGALLALTRALWWHEPALATEAF